LKISESLKQEGIINKDFPDSNLLRAGMICKCDLVTDLVVEFPELQGLVGKEYAREKGEADELSDAVFEHYLPRFAGDILPATVTGAILSLADKFDTISGMFLTGNIPSGSEDPFALRRKALGIVLTSLDKEFDFDISSIIRFSIGLYIESFDFKDKKELKKKDDTAGIAKSADTTDGKAAETLMAVFDFIMARYRFMLEKQGKRTDIFEAVVSAGCNSMTQLDLRYKALETYIAGSGDVLKLSEPLTRCKNIIKGRQFGKVDAKLLKDDAELMLYETLTQKEKVLKNHMASKSFDSAIAELASFADSINYFFEKVLVMDNDEGIKQNRLNLIKSCTELYYLFADFSKIS
jgi:glycyl-tRNA synthetase beta chain